MNYSVPFAIFFAALLSNPIHLKTLYNSLDPHSVAQHLAFYELYPSTPEGKQAMHEAWNLMAHGSFTSSENLQPFLPVNGINAVVALVNKQPQEIAADLNDHELALIEKLGQNLLNRKLKGHQISSEEDALKLPSHEIDLARGLFLSQFGNTPEGLNKVRQYEAMLDLMALQILVKTPLDSSPEKKIRAINHFIFDEMRFRFPPHSAYAKDIDIYTFLPSVLDSRRGVCLGVSILYICLAQRLGLDLEMVTPPGHIYVRYANGGEEINIETTARGINIPSEEYLGIETRFLQQRNVKEVIGLAYFNQASTFWQEEDYDNAVKTYEKAQLYLPNDFLLMELLAYNYLFSGQIAKGKELLKKVRHHVPEHAVSRENLADDYLDGHIDVEGIKACLCHVDETRESILKKRDRLQEILKQYPKFRSGYFGLAVTWLQLHRQGEALEILKYYHSLDDSQPTAEYYLAVLNAERMDYNQAWKHYKNTEKLLAARDHFPKALKQFRKELSLRYPE